MQAFNCNVIARRPQRVLPADGSLAREASLRLVKPMRVGRPLVIGVTGDARHPARRRWVSGLSSASQAPSSSSDNAGGKRHASGSW